MRACILLTAGTLQFWRENGIQGDTAPLELNRGELSRRDNRNSEMILYGRSPMMISSQCLKKNLDRCTGACSLLTLKDRMGKQFPVQCVCGSCYNVIYNSLPTSLIGEWGTIRNMGFRSYRLNFTVESGREAAETARKFAAVLGGKREAESPNDGKEYTKRPLPAQSGVRGSYDKNNCGSFKNTCCFF